jgi:hypothetical protein
MRMRPIDGLTVAFAFALKQGRLMLAIEKNAWWRWSGGEVGATGKSAVDAGVRISSGAPLRNTLSPLRAADSALWGPVQHSIRRSLHQMGSDDEPEQVGGHVRNHEGYDIGPDEIHGRKNASRPNRSEGWRPTPHRHVCEEGHCQGDEPGDPTRSNQRAESLNSICPIQELFRRSHYEDREDEEPRWKIGDPGQSLLEADGTELRETPRRQGPEYSNEEARPAQTQLLSTTMKPERNPGHENRNRRPQWKRHTPLRRSARSPPRSTRAKRSSTSLRRR